MPRHWCERCGWVQSGGGQILDLLQLCTAAMLVNSKEPEVPASVPPGSKLARCPCRVFFATAQEQTPEIMSVSQVIAAGALCRKAVQWW